MVNNDLKSIISNLGLISQLGMVVVLCLVIGLILGILADKWCNQQVVFKIIGIILGLGAGIYQAFRIVVNKIK